MRRCCVLPLNLSSNDRRPRCNRAFKVLMGTPSALAASFSEQSVSLQSWMARRRSAGNCRSVSSNSLLCSTCWYTCSGVSFWSSIKSLEMDSSISPFTGSQEITGFDRAFRICIRAASVSDSRGPGQEICPTLKLIQMGKRCQHQHPELHPQRPVAWEEYEGRWQTAYRGRTRTAD